MISSPNSRFCVSCTSKVTPRLVLKSQVLREVGRFPFVMRLHKLVSIFRRPLRGPRTTLTQLRIESTEGPYSADRSVYERP